MSAAPCALRPMRADEVGFAIELAAREGWNPGLHDAACFHAADPGGCLIAEADGAPVGCISAVAYGERFGFIGLYIVVPERRGQGIGLALWTYAMQRLRGRLIGLDGVPAQQDNYRRSGFRLAWRNTRYGGVVRHAADGRAAARIVELRDIDFAAVCADDRRVFPAPRAAFWRAWLTMPDAHALACLDDAGGLAAWGVARRCRHGWKIGPLNAGDRAGVEALYRALCLRLPAGDAVFVDVPLPNAEAVAFADGAGLRPGFETARMYTGDAPACELARVFGIATFELG